MHNEITVEMIGVNCNRLQQTTDINLQHCLSDNGGLMGFYFKIKLVQIRITA